MIAPRIQPSLGWWSEWYRGTSQAKLWSKIWYRKNRSFVCTNILGGLMILKQNCSSFRNKGKIESIIFQIKIKVKTSAELNWKVNNRTEPQIHPERWLASPKLVVDVYCGSTTAMQTPMILTINICMFMSVILSFAAHHIYFYYH